MRDVFSIDVPRRACMHACVRACAPSVVHVLLVGLRRRNDPGRKRPRRANGQRGETPLLLELVAPLVKTLMSPKIFAKMQVHSKRVALRRGAVRLASLRRRVADGSIVFNDCYARRSCYGAAGRAIIIRNNQIKFILSLLSRCLQASSARLIARARARTRRSTLPE